MKALIEGIDGKALAAANLLVAGHKDIRSYLRAVNIKAHPQGAIVTGCNGHALIVALSPGATVHETDQKDAKGGYTIDLGKPPAALAKCDHVNIYYVGGRQVILQGKGVSLICDLIEHQYINTHADIDPALRAYREEPGKAAWFNPELMGKFDKAAKLYHKSMYPRAMANPRGDLVAIVTFANTPNLFGLIMPMNTKNVMPVVEWITETTTNEEIEA